MTKYELPTETIIAIIDAIPKDKWPKFCEELMSLLTSMSASIDAMKMLSELGLIEYEVPKTITWEDDGDNSATVIIRETTTGDSVSVLVKGENNNNGCGYTETIIVKACERRE